MPTTNANPTLLLHGSVSGPAPAATSLTQAGQPPAPPPYEPSLVVSASINLPIVATSPTPSQPFATLSPFPTASQVLGGAFGGMATQPPTDTTTFQLTPQAMPLASAWGANRLAQPPAPSALPSELGARIFPNLPSAATSNPAPFSVRSALVGPSTDRTSQGRGLFQSSGSKNRKAVVDLRPIGAKTYYCIPNPDVETLSAPLKFALAKVGLMKHLTIRQNYSLTQVDAAVRDAFGAIVDFNLHSYA